MVSLAQRSGSRGWIQQRQRMEDWGFLRHCGGKGQGNGILLLSLLSSPSHLPFLILSVLLQVPSGSQLLGWARDAAFPSKGFQGDGDRLRRGYRSPGPSQGISQGGRVVESLGEERGRERRKRRVGRKDGGALPLSQAQERWWSSLTSQKAGQSPSEHRSANLSQLLPQLQLCPSCQKWNETQSSPRWGPVSAQH